MRLLQGFFLLLAVAATSGFHVNDSGQPQRIEVRTKRFRFEPAEVTVHKGQPVILELRSEDVTHGLVIKELGIRSEIKKGQTEEITFTPQQEGTFTGKCAHFCGVGHGSMALKIHVTE